MLSEYPPVLTRDIAGLLRVVAFLRTYHAEIPLCIVQVFDVLRAALLGMDEAYGSGGSETDLPRGASRY